MVPASTTIPTAASPTGSNVLDPQARLLYVTTRGGPSSQQYDILTTQRIKLNLVLSVSVEEFFGDTLVTNIATLLGYVALRARPCTAHCLLSRSCAVCIIVVHVSKWSWPAFLSFSCLCSIPSNRIKVVSVHAGSVNVEVEINDYTPPVNGAVTSVSDKITSLLSAGQFAVGYGVNNATVTTL